MNLILSTLKRVKNIMKVRASQAGFTMIELLIVIAILGILAVAVLSAINPVEQINRGRDTGSRSDVEQLLSAIDRFNAFQGYFPWQEDADDTDAIELTLRQVTDDDVAFGVNNVPGCTVLGRLSSGDDDIPGCVASQELKESFVNRIDEPSTRSLYVFNNGDQGDSTYVCFVPQSGAFITEAENRCTSGLPEDLEPIEGEICNTGGSRAIIQEGDAPAICLP